MSIPRSAVLGVAACLAWAAGPGAAAAETDAVRADEEAVRHAGLATDGASLLEYFRKRTPGEDARQSIEALVRDLSHKRFKAREDACRALVVIGPAALAP